MSVSKFSIRFTDKSGRGRNAQQGPKNKGGANTKLIVAIILDLLDFTFGRIIGFGTVTDILITFVAVFMFGWKGLIQLWEAVEPTDQIDGFVPTLTLLALWERRQNSSK